MGREAYHNPWLLAEVDARLFGQSAVANTRHNVIEQLLPYVAGQLEAGAQLNHITRHILGLFQGVPGARRFRRHLSENAHKPGAGIEVLTAALEQVGQVQHTMANAGSPYSVTEYEN